MWHLHGLLMVLAFIILYPLGVYLLRSPRPTAFNYHWTIQALGSISLFLGAVIGYWQSHSISIVHQYIGLAVTAAVLAQLVLGWRHHVTFLRIKTGTWMSKVHVYLGRVVLPLGMVNIFSGLKLRDYGWLTLGSCLAVMIIELVVLAIYVRQAGKRGVRIGGPGTGVAGGRDKGVGLAGMDEAEEYFQLTAEDDEFSDSDGEEVGGGGSTRNTDGNANREREREREREKAERLRRLDKV
jgi:hypothetical protein